MCLHLKSTTFIVQKNSTKLIVLGAFVDRYIFTESFFFGDYKFFYPKLHIFAYLICKLLIHHTIYHYQVILCRFEKLLQGVASHLNYICVYEIQQSYIVIIR